MDQAANGTGPTAAKMQAALTYASQQTHVPWVQLPARVFDTGTASFDWFHGMKVCGAGVESAPKNQELGLKSVNGTWKTSCGTGANSLLRTAGTLQSVGLSNIQFHAGGNTSQIVRASGGAGLYPSVFHNLSLYGGPYFFGNPAEKFLTTQMVFSGHWTVLGYKDTPFTLGGGDCSLWMSGYLNSNSAGAGGGKPIVDLSGMGKTNVGLMYLTAQDDWVGLRIQGGSDKGLAIFGGMYEGRSQSNLATRPVIEILGGSVDFFGPWVAQVASGVSTVSGAVHQSAGTAYFHGGTYHRGAATPGTFPFLYQTGGVARFYGPPRSVTGDAIVLRWKDGTSQSVAPPVNGVVA